MENKNQKSKNAEREEEVLKFWKEKNIFQKSLEKESPNGEYVFYDGPVTANSKPVLHTMEPFSFKDVIPRYKTMRGFHVRRKGGWDTHGLPVELQIEKKLGFSSKKDIEEYGIAKFNKECKASVWEYIQLWKDFTSRMGYWADQDNPYVTCHNDYMESVWNVIKTANDKNLLYKDYKVVPWCPRCGTTLSSHELAQGYQDVKDLSVTAKFKVKGQDNTYILAWTTTPWTLPGNVALAVGNKIDYVKVLVNSEIGIPENNQIKNSLLGEYYYIAKSKIGILDGVINKSEIQSEKTLEKTIRYKIIEELKGSDLVGSEYEPLYPFMSETISDAEKPKLEYAFKVYAADFVTDEDGTGVVHTAVMYGVDDFDLGTKIGLPKHHLVGLDGKYLAGTGPFEGRFVRDEDVAIDIIKDLAHRGQLFKKEKYEHSYPHCWRCKTALIYYARDSWYIRMTALRDVMVKENQEINWEPSYIKDGRFGEWLKDIKDWAISRERYWGTPLPVWSCNTCKNFEVIGSISDLKSKTKKSGNKYFVMRHGEAENNLNDLVSTAFNDQDRLTEKGKEQVKESALRLKEKNIDYILTSPFVRTTETSEIVASVLGLDESKVIVDDRLHEMSLPEYEGQKWSDYHKTYPNTVEFFSHKDDGNESYNDVKKRTMNFLYDIDTKYTGKNILVVTHGGPAWLAVAGCRGLSAQESLNMIKNFNYLLNAQFEELDFVPISHNEDYELDLHRPYIDEVKLVCACGGNLERTKDVMDVWLDSGAMPFAQDHYPFENKELVEGKGYPADFISEAIDQTRGWFYTLHAVGNIMGRGKAYKNVICLGHLLDANGKKMSKSLGNIVDPWIMMNKYGVDSLRLWMYSVNQPGEPKNFDEKTVSELNNKIFNLLYNVLAFYDLYRNKNLENNIDDLESKNILDKWIIARLNKLLVDTTNYIETYKILEPVRAFREFIDELSTWYVRRSREKLKDGDIEAKQTLYYVIKTLIKIMAPFTPFTSEDIWQKLKGDNDKESIHLIDWPVVQFKIENEESIINDMKKAREIITLGLEARQKAGIKVRQPLSALIIKNYELDKEYTQIIKEELNIKMVVVDDKIQEEVKINTEISLELKQEGQYRELVRAIQDKRKLTGLSPSDVISLEIEAGVKEQEILNLFKDDLLKTVGAKEINFKENEGIEIVIDDLVFKINF